MADPITITASTFSIVAQALQLIHDVTELSQDAQNDFHGLENTIDRLSDRITCMNRQIIRRDHRDRFEHRVCKVIDLLASLEKILQDSIAISNGMSVKGGYIKALWRWKFGRASKAAWCEKEINAELECLVELQSQWTKQDAEQKANLELEYLRGLPVSPYSLLFNRVDDFSVTSLISSACQELGDLEADQVQGGILG